MTICSDRFLIGRAFLWYTLPPSLPLIGITELAEKSLQNPFYKRLMYQNT